jgi:hypothetical protein
MTIYVFLTSIACTLGIGMCIGFLLGRDIYPGGDDHNGDDRP